jgi:hypothetical protein
MVNAGYSGYAFFDSGSNAYYLVDSSLKACSDNAFYCPSVSVTDSASVSSYSDSNTSATVTMTVANADALYLFYARRAREQMRLLN